MKQILIVFALSVLFCNHVFANEDIKVEVQNMKYVLNKMEENIQRLATNTQDANVILAKIEERVNQNTDDIRELTDKIDSIAELSNDSKKKIDLLYLAVSLIGSCGVLVFHKNLLLMINRLNKSVSIIISKTMKYDEDDSYDEKL